MVFAEGTLTFKEFVLKEMLPLSAIQDAILEFLHGESTPSSPPRRSMNVDEPRMTQDVDILSTRARELADELREYLHARFQISVSAAP
jgi:hypothetical protein